jgi:hypothetical protein
MDSVSLTDYSQTHHQTSNKIAERYTANVGNQNIINLRSTETKNKVNQQRVP